MTPAVHIPERDLTDVKSLLDLARCSATVIIDAEGESFFLSRSPGKTIDEIFANPNLAAAVNGLDKDWAVDLEQIIATRKIDQDLWAE